MPLHTVVTAQPNQHMAPWPRDPVRAKTPPVPGGPGRRILLLSFPWLGPGTTLDSERALERRWIYSGIFYFTYIGRYGAHKPILY